MCLLGAGPAGQAIFTFTDRPSIAWEVEPGALVATM